MIDDLPITTSDKQVVPTRGIPRSLAEPLLAYDYFKSMTSVAVGTLGGILTLSGTVFGERIAPWQMAVTAALVALSGMIALQAKTDIVQVTQGVKPPMDTSRVALRLVPMLYGMGVGIFLGFLALSYMAPNMWR